MLWIALHLPALSLESFAATLGTARHTQPLALLETQRIQAVNRVALQLGVKPGLKRATALALAPQLLLGQADSVRDAQTLHAVAHAALAFTPAVTLDTSAALPCVLLEAQGSLRYFGGLPALQRRLCAALAPLGLSWRMASAPTALGAALLARWREGFEHGAHSRRRDALCARLDAVPLELLAAGRAQADALQGMGLHNLGDLRRLPRDGLARRFGAALLDEIDRARGDLPDPRDWLTPEPTFEARLELFERADRADQLLHGAALLLVRLVAWATARQARIAAFTLRMRHEPRHRGDTHTPAHTELDIALAEASNDTRHLQLLLRERLAQLQLPAPTNELRLYCRQLQHRPAPNGELFATPGSAREGLTRLIELLQARLGPDQVHRLALREDHRPEHGTAWQPALASGSAAHQPSTPAETPHAGAMVALTRPVWLLRRAQALPERESRPLLEGRPLHLLAGPERIEAGWWDGELATRDYFIAQAHDDALVWIYRQRLPLAQPEGEGWFLQGRFG